MELAANSARRKDVVLKVNARHPLDLTYAAPHLAITQLLLLLAPDVTNTIE